MPGDVLAQTLAAGQGRAWPLEDARAGSGPMGGRRVGRGARWCAGRRQRTPESDGIGRRRWWRR